MLLQKQFIRARGSSLNSVVSTHNRARPTLHHRRAERREICVLEIVRGRVRVEPVALRFGSTVDCEMLRCGDDSRMHRIVSLQTAYERYGEASRQKGVLTVGFLSPAPA